MNCWQPGFTTITIIILCSVPPWSRRFLLDPEAPCVALKDEPDATISYVFLYGTQRARSVVNLLGVSHGSVEALN